MKTFQYAMRFLLRARSYTLINLLRLAFSLACCIVLLRYIHREYTVDVHCVDRNEVYAVRVDMEGNSYWGAYSVYQDSILIAPELIDVTCRFTPLDNDYLISDGHRYPCAALATDSTFFRLFSFRTVQGEQDLNDPSSVILTEGYAYRLFGKENPIGKTIRYSNGKDFVVKGVIAKPENKAWLNFDLLLPDTPSNHWERMPLELYRFVAGADMDQINRIGSYPRRVNPHWPDDTRMYTFSLVPLKECYWSGLKTTEEGHIYVWGDRAQLRIFISLCVLLLLTGILNFINLYLIFMLKRTHEYGIRRVFGAGKFRMFSHIFVENLLLSAFAVLLAWGLIELTRIPVEHFFGFSFPYTAFDWQLSLALLFLLPLVASLYPYFRFTRIQPSVSIRSVSTGNRSVRARMFLLFLQYTVTFLLVVIAIYFNRQLDLMLHTDPGYRTENILVASLVHESKDYSSYRDKESIEARRNRVRQIDAMVGECPDIDCWMVDYSCLAPSDYGTNFIGKDGRKAFLHIWYASPVFFRLYDLHVVEGSLPSLTGDEGNEDYYVVNRAGLKALGYDSCQGAYVIAESDQQRGSNPKLHPIVAVIDDYYDGHISTGVRPMIFQVMKRSSGDIYSISFRPGRLPAVLDYLKKVEREAYGMEEFEYILFSDKVKQMYAADRQLAVLYSAFAFMAIVVSCLGLFGISLFDIRQRYREIAIRKVHGARLSDLYRLLLRKYLLILGGAFLISIPLSGYVIHLYTLDMVVKASLNAGIFLLALLVVGLISIGTLLWQVRKATRISPADVMRSE